MKEINEESPDEILARRIEQLQAKIEQYTPDLNNEDTDIAEFARRCVATRKQDLAMLEAMRAFRDAALPLVAMHHNDELGYSSRANREYQHCTCPACKAYRQSDDAIRGMRG